MMRRTRKMMRFARWPRWLGLLFGLALSSAVLLSACLPGENRPVTPTPPAGASIPGSELLRDLGPAPELTNEVWLNTDQPLRLEDLRGKVVLLDMWTYG